ncbi:MAG: hypothetical protein AAFU03_01970, partial [Bacteroidota bacterium]
MYCTLFRLGKGSALLIVAYLLTASLLHASGLELPPPIFVDAPPNDTTVTCFSDAPDVVLLKAQTIDGIVEVTPFDSLENGETTICTGGILFRIWEVTDSEGTTRVQQEITFGPPNDGPSISPEIITTPDTVECTQVNDFDDPLSYDSWLRRNALRVEAAAIPGCAPIESITNDGPPFLIGADCDDDLEVTYTVTDQCGASVQVTFTYEIEDTTPPIITGVGPDETISCDDPIPGVPDIFVDDCNSNPTVVFSVQNTQVFDGTCNEFEYQIIRTWTATDSCGNSSSVSQTITVVDNEQPSFQRPFNMEIDCTQDWENLSITGNVSNLLDNCTPANELVVEFEDEIITQPDCNFNFNVRRTWSVTDRCGNTNVQVQNIFVGDDLAPLYTAPADVSVNCEDIFNFSVVGEPTDLIDNCTDNPNTSFEDEIIEGPCPNTFQIRRTWRIFDDCGNDDFHLQNIEVVDTTGPVFITPPADLITTCNNEEFQDEVFNLWVLDFAGARASDACTADEDITYEIYVSGTTIYPLLPEFSCEFQDQTVRQMDVDVIATDECGNSTTTTVSFRQIDTQPPNVFDCPESMVVATDSGRCDANIGLPIPTIVDQCVTGLPISHQTGDTVAITSDALPGEEGSTPVNTVVLNFPVLVTQPVNALLPSASALASVIVKS